MNRFMEMLLGPIGSELMAADQWRLGLLGVPTNGWVALCAAMLGIGAVLLARFLKKYPVADEEEG